MKTVPDGLTLNNLQNLIKKLIVERGFDNESVPEVFMLFLEEAGEFAKAARKISGIKSDDSSKKLELDEEAADVLWLLVDLCNRLGIDLEKAFLAKEEKNKSRKWS